MSIDEMIRQLNNNLMTDDRVINEMISNLRSMEIRLQAAEAIIEYADQMSDAFPFSDRDLPDCVQELNQAIHNWRAAGKGE